jgi:Tfp pilus tip-associated adhesin PilY1
MILAQYPQSGNDYLDVANVAQRRVFYAQQGEEPGDWARGMRLFDPIAFDAQNSRPVRFDLWRGMGFTFADSQAEQADAAVNSGVASAANGVVDFTLRLKTGSELNTDVDPPVATPHEFLIGDIFHSTPVVIGTPTNTNYFAVDLYGNGRECDPDDGTAAANPGYRCFFEKQRFRRKMLLLGSNDGMLHAFDAGMFRTSGTDHWTGADLVHPQTSPFGSFDNGTGKELFGFVPRSVLPRLREMAQPNAKHRFTVDGTVTVADVFVDPLRQDPQGAFPVPAERQWRTAVIGGLREGGRGYYALDITQPDPVEPDSRADSPLAFLPETASGGSNHPQSGDYVPECSAALQPNALGVVPPPADSGCGPAPFPAVLWEFTDSFFDPADGRTWFADEEEVEIEGTITRGNGRPDLAATWSTPSVGRIRLCRPGGTACDPTPDDPDGAEDDDLVDVFVAVVGGGMDPQTKLHDWRQGPPTQDGERIEAGNWIYIIDIETGEAIYKRAVQGAVPSEPAAVDTDGDGYLDRIYVGTLGGFLYRIDLDEIDDGGDDALPALVQQPVVYSHRTGSTVDQRFDQTRARLPLTVYPPVKLFDTNFDGANPLPIPTPPRAIYQRPSVIFQAGSGQFVLAFGTGDRDDLWNIPVTAPNERFYVFIDEFDSAAQITTPKIEASLAAIDPEVTAPTSSNLLVGSGGWVMRLAPKERVITDAFALSGVTVFSTFVPRTEDGEGNETVVGCVDGQVVDGSASKTCAKQGLSHVFVVNTTNANGLLFEGDTDVTTRFKTAPTFVTNPFAEPGQTRNAGSQNDAGEHTADDLSPNMLRVMETLQGLFPPQCKFASYRIDIKTVAADTSLQFIAPVPVCLIESNWKEF